MKFTIDKWKLKEILSCRFEEKSKDQATNLPKRNLHFSQADVKFKQFFLGKALRFETAGFVVQFFS